MADNRLQIEISAVDHAGGILGKLSGQFNQLNADVDKISRRFTELNTALTSMVGAISLAGVGMMAKSFIDAGLQVERLQKLFTAAAGSANLGAREFEYVRGVSEKMGLDVAATAQSYGKFMAAIRGTTLEGESGRKVFEAVSGATTALGLSADETSGVFNALQQMMSKGKVQAEELRGQLGERLPGAFKMAADAMGLTTAELDKQLKDGKVLADDLLPKLAVQLELTYGKAAAEGARSAAAEINRMNNAMFDAKATAGSALIPVFTDIVKAITPALEKLKEFIGGLQILAVKAAALPDRLGAMWTVAKSGKGLLTKDGQAMYADLIAGINANEQAVIDDIMKKFTLTGSDYTSAEIAKQLSNKRTASPSAGKKVQEVDWRKFMADQYNMGPFTPDQINSRGEMTADQQEQFDQAVWARRNAMAELQQAEEDEAEANQAGIDAWAKRREELKFDQEVEAAVIQDGIEAWEKRREEIQFNAEVEEAYLQEHGTFIQGINRGLDEYLKSLKTVFQQGEFIAMETAKAMEQAFGDFFFDALQGKLKDLEDYLLAFLATVQKALAQIMAEMAAKGLTSWFQGYLNPSALPGQGNSTGVLQSDQNPGGWNPSLPQGNKFAGGAANNLRVEISNHGQPVEAQSAGMNFDAHGAVISIVLKEIKSSPSFRTALAGVR